MRIRMMAVKELDDMEPAFIDEKWMFRVSKDRGGDMPPFNPRKTHFLLSFS
jgi:hypothetical protein